MTRMNTKKEKDLATNKHQSSRIRKVLYREKRK